MDNISEYVPLLIILASIIFTALGRKKKPAKSTQETALPQQTAEELIDESIFSQVFADFYQKPVEEKPKKQVNPKPEIRPEKKVESLSSTPIIIESEEEADSPFSFKEEDDLIRAIVYTEIINRKEY